MGQSIVLACPPTWNLDLLYDHLKVIVPNRSIVLSNQQDQLQAVEDHGRWQIVITELKDTQFAIEDYASNGDLSPAFRREILGMRLFSVRFNEINVARELIRAIAEGARTREEALWIDTDYGWVISGTDALECIKREVDWDWRHNLTP